MDRKISFQNKGFTLIELLIVVAIIAILAAIAVPNFLEAQVRAKVSSVKSDMRTLAVAIESYAVDHSKYPILNGRLVVEPSSSNLNRGGSHLLWVLTTPIAYTTSVDKADPFAKQFARDVTGDVVIDGLQTNYHYSLGYINIIEFRNGGSHVPAWGLFSLGPDHVKGPDATNGSNWSNSDYGRDPPAGYPDPRFGAWQYDSTNGTKSAGDILHWQ